MHPSPQVQNRHLHDGFGQGFPMAVAEEEEEEEEEEENATGKKGIPGGQLEPMQKPKFAMGEIWDSSKHVRAACLKSPRRVS